MRPAPGEILYELLDDDGRVIAELTLETLADLFDAARAPAVA